MKTGLPTEERQDERANIVEKLGLEFKRVLTHELVACLGVDRRTGQVEDVYVRIVEDRAYIYTYSETVKL